MSPIAAAFAAEAVVAAAIFAAFAHSSGSVSAFIERFLQ